LRVTGPLGAVLYPVEVAQSTDISLAAKGLYAYILSMKAPQFLTISGAAMDLKETEAAIKAALLQLEAYGLVDTGGQV
jgi:hypothetical protein